MGGCREEVGRREGETTCVLFRREEAPSRDGKRNQGHPPVLHSGGRYYCSGHSFTKSGFSFFYFL